MTMTSENMLHGSEVESYNQSPPQEPEESSAFLRTEFLQRSRMICVVMPA